MTKEIIIDTKEWTDIKPPIVISTETIISTEEVYSMKVTGE